jgi:predicted RNA-binding protein with TRAM domain
MEISERLISIFSTDVESDGGRYVIEIPKREIEAHTVSQGMTYRVAVLDKIGEETQQQSKSTQSDEEAVVQTDFENSGPPVAEGDRLTVEIKDLGSKGDGLTTIEDGYVIIVPGTGVGEEVTIEMTSVRDNVGFANVVD